jgi:hypothetical protein
VTSSSLPSAKPSSFRTRFRHLRIAVLLLILGVVALTTFAQQRNIATWKRPLTVLVVPVDPGADRSVSAWVSGLDRSAFEGVAEFFGREAGRYHIKASPPVLVRVAKPIPELPPPPPDPPTALDVVTWSLKLRYWSWSIGRQHQLPAATIRIYVVYDPAGSEAELERSFGLQKVNIGVVHAPAGSADHGWTQLAIAHELLHTVGASDKYRLGQPPPFPDGFADPQQEPRYPQHRAEIMAGQIPLAENGAFTPAHSLADCVVGAATATEIGWPRPAR